MKKFFFAAILLCSAPLFASDVVQDVLLKIDTLIAQKNAAQHACTNIVAEVAKSKIQISPSTKFADGKYRSQAMDLLYSLYKERCQLIGAPQNPRYLGYVDFNVQFIDAREAFDFYKSKIPFSKFKYHKSSTVADDIEVALVINNQYALTFSLIEGEPVIHEVRRDVKATDPKAPWAEYERNVLFKNLYNNETGKKNIPLAKVNETPLSIPKI